MTNELRWPPSETTARRQEAAGRAEQIRLGLQSTAVLYAQAVAERDWHTLGYRSLTAWTVAEFGPDRFSPERRKEIVALLTAAGHTQRAIAAVAGTSQSTVKRDQQAAGESAGSPGGPGELTGEAGQPAPLLTPRQRAARDRETAKREVAQAEEVISDAVLKGRAASGAAATATAALTPVQEEPPQRPARGSPTDVVTQSGDAGEALRTSAVRRWDIEEIIAADLTRGQIMARFGVGEHAAQLARVAAVAVMGERRRVANLVADLRKEADAYLEFRRGAHSAETVDTDRVKIKQFLDWLAEKNRR